LAIVPRYLSSRGLSLLSSVILALLLCAPSAAQASSDLSQLGAFTGAAVVTPTSGTFIGDLTILDVQAGADQYMVKYATSRFPKDMGVSISGAVGRKLFDPENTAPASDCEHVAGAPATYCVVIGGMGPTGSPVGEVFGNYKVKGSPAFVARVSCCADPAWTVAWYDASSDTSYSIMVLDDPVPLLKVGVPNPSDMNAANQLVAWVVEQLVPYNPATSGTATQTGVVTPQAVWKPANGGYVDYTSCYGRTIVTADCVATMMQKGGASPEAIAFARSQDGAVFARDFQSFGPVAVVQVICTMATNFNCGYSYLIVNGNPSTVEVGWRKPDPELVAAVKADPVYDELTAQLGEFSDIFWAGEDKFAGAQSYADNGIELLFWSPVKAGHAGDAAGRIFIAYDFQADGQYAGAHLDHVSSAE
jgi:hypothetical protein